MNIAIDGPAGGGKRNNSKKVGKEVDFFYLGKRGK